MYILLFQRPYSIQTLVDSKQLLSSQLYMLSVIFGNPILLKEFNKHSMVTLTSFDIWNISQMGRKDI